MVIFLSLAWYWAVAIFIVAFLCFSFVGRNTKNNVLRDTLAGDPHSTKKNLASITFCPTKQKSPAHSERFSPTMSALICPE